MVIICFILSIFSSVLFIVTQRNDTNYLGNQCEELTVRLSKYEERVKEFEEQNEKHNEIHDKMKLRLKELTLKIEEQRSEV